MKHWDVNTRVAGQQFGYAFDTIANRSGTTAGGDENGASPRSATYGANHLNQYTNRTVPAAIDVIGSASPTANVLVNDQAPYRKGGYCRTEVPGGPKYSYNGTAYSQRKKSRYPTKQSYTAKSTTTLLPTCSSIHTRIPQPSTC